MTVLSMTDPLTGLHNRRGFVDSLETLAAEDASKAKGALFYIDLDNFKRVNDTHGHQTGDEALLDVAALMKEQTRGGDLAARLGGDEFEIGRAHVCTPVTHAQLVCRLLLENKNKHKRNLTKHIIT